MIELVSNVVLLITALLLVSIVFYGWGQITFVILGTRKSLLSPAATVWIGFCTVLFFIQLIHLFVAIDWRVSVAVMALGLGRILLFDQAKISSVLPNAGSLLKTHPWYTLLGFILVVLLCLRAMQLPTMYDSGLYHFSSIRWTNEQPIVPGLGNLHWRLALNQSYFGFLALLNVFPVWGKGYALGGLFLLTFGLVSLLEMSSVIKSKWPIGVFVSVLIIYLLLLSPLVANPSPDLAVAVLQVIIFSYLLVVVLERDANALHRQQLLIVILFLSVAIATVKLSSVGFAAACAVLVFWYLLKLKVLCTSLVLRAAALLIAVVMLYIGRGYLLSGAPFFPSPLGGIWSLPWAVAPGVAEFESKLIYAWARSPGIAAPHLLPAGFGWIPNWFDSFPKPVLLLICFAVALCFYRLFVPNAKALGDRPQSTDVLYTPLIAGIIFWFVTAPDLRFLGATGVLLFVLSACGAITAINSLWTRFTKEHTRTKSILLIGLGFVFLWKGNVFAFLPNAAWPEITRPEVVTQRSFKNAEVSVPKEGAQCWDASLPCAVGVSPSLKTVEMPRTRYFDHLLSKRFMYSIQE
jgi:hypothetical protein